MSDALRREGGVSNDIFTLLTVFIRICGIFRAVFNFVIPDESGRYELTLKTALFAFAYYVPLQLLALLSRRKNTRKLRIHLLPVTLIMIVIGTFWFGKPYHPSTFLSS